MSIRRSVRPSVHPSVGPWVRNAFFSISQKWLKMIRINQKSHQNNFQTLLQSFFPNLSFTITFFNLYKIWDASLYPRVLVFLGISQNGGKRSKMTLHISSGFLLLSFTHDLSFYLSFTISLSQSFFHNLSFSIFLSQSLFLNHSFTIFLWQSFLHSLSSTFFLPPSFFHNFFFSICIYRSLFQSLQNVGRIVVCSWACLVNASRKDVVYLCSMKKKFYQFVRFFWLEIPSTQNFNTPQQHLIIALNSSYLHLI